MYADFQIESYTYRLIATYLPHAGYPHDEFLSCLCDLRDIVLDGQRRNYKCILGGDFNTEIGRGSRSAVLMNFVCELGPTICNVADDDDIISQWTFRSSLGRKRRIDYIIVDSGLNSRSSEATNDLDLGSDHRAVHANIDLVATLSCRSRPRRKNYKGASWDCYAEVLDSKLSSFSPVSCLSDLESLAVDAASELPRTAAQHDHASFQYDQLLQKLRRARRNTRNPIERRVLSKQIWRESRKILRRQQTIRTTKVLEEFRDLDRLGHIAKPLSRKARQGPDFDSCSQLLKQVYTSDDTNDGDSSDLHSLETAIPEFTTQEVMTAVSQMAKGRTTDRNGVVLEMFLYGGELLLNYLTYTFNSILMTGNIPNTWRESFFTLLHKGGDAKDPNNWRPIAVLSITYKILARTIHNRVHRILDKEQSDEQFGFRNKRSTIDALILAESVISKSLEFNTDLWLVSVDLSKAFGRVEHSALFTALQSQGLDAGYCKLLQSVYSEQFGFLTDGNRFPIGRGVRQGDVLSSLLFNCALEAAIRKWKARLTRHGIPIVANCDAEHLTNIRFADDLLLFASSSDDAITMLNLLTVSLREFGLELNVKKTKLLSTSTMSPDTILFETADGFVELIAAGRTHKYLGRAWPGNLRDRGGAALDHRVSCAWAKFRENEASLMNRNINIKLRLKLFSATVSPTLLYSLDTCPLTLHQLSKLDILQRKMIRKMVGWIFDEDESWTERGRRMKHRLQTALSAFPIQSWSEAVLERKRKLLFRIQVGQSPPLVRSIFNWEPFEGHRFRGRPRCRWDDFCL